MKKNLLKSLITAIFFFTAQQMESQCTFTTVAYYESFQTITGDDQLPLCWAASDLGNACKTYSNFGGFGGNALAAFQSVPTATNYFYSIGLALHPGVTYSVSLWKKIALANSLNWNLAILLGNTQTPIGLTTIKPLAPVTNTMYTSTSNTFNVNTSGTYYIAIMSTSSSSTTGDFLYWEDIFVTMPCLVSPNSPTVTISATSTVYCSGNSGPTLTANGANTYTWYNGTVSQTLIPSIQVNSNLYVDGTNTITHCPSTGTIALEVLPSPVVIVISSQPSVCIGQSAKLTAGGASSFSWSTGATTPTTIVSPIVNTNYTVTGTNQYNCSTTAFVFVGVHHLPTITINPDTSTICAGNEAIISASGANYSYSWSSVPLESGSSVTINPVSSGNFTVSGMNNNGCISSAVGNLIVSECMGINDHETEGLGHLFPNPCKDQLTISGTTEAKEIVILDLMGIEVMKTLISVAIPINVSSLASGLYTVLVAGRKLRLVKE